MSDHATALAAALLSALAVLLVPGSGAGPSIPRDVRRLPARVHDPVGASAPGSRPPGEGTPSSVAPAPAGRGAGDSTGWARRGRTEKRRRARDDRQLLSLLDQLVPALRAGLPVAAALGHPVADSTPARRPEARWWGPVTGARDGGEPTDWVTLLRHDLAAEAASGRPLAQVWAGHAARSCSLEGAFVARAWALSETLGAPLAESVAQASSAIRQRLARTQRLEVVMAGPRATARVLTLLPASGPLVALALGIPPTRMYSGAGAVCAASGLLVLLLGRWWCARLLGTAGRPLPASGNR